ncbi:hypothetical protein PR003_g22081 [Phytophthora rubi]|uniref:MULE transposase domain-containing protein n=1 Tax=Phytophthora rubi TaxID=129364 RepID=A0A6A4D7T4_9STRA|nr:hypothetical protein PR003_g22081 [Phytophthora rubi]
MRSRIVLCESQRCQAQLDTSDDGDVSPLTKCPCRYKFKLCLSTSVCEVFQQGHHIMDINDPLTPVKRKLTEEMKVYITECLATGEKTTATRLYTVLDTLIDNDEMAGPAPWLSQVTDFVKNLRRKNPKDSMAPMIELCDSRLYDQLDIATLPARDMVILCDSQVESTPGASGRVSHLGDGSKTYTLRVGMTCLQMIHNYIAVQDRDDCTTILHVDSTHSMVINGYVVFAFGYSDQCGHFFPMVYFCTSHKRAIDIGWCISGVACPGVSMRTRQFVRPSHVHRFAHADDDSEDSDDQTVAAYPAAAESDPECEDDNDTSNPAGGTLNPAGENRSLSDQMGVPVTTSPAPSTTSVTTTEELEDEDEQQQSAPIAAPAPAVPPARVWSRPRQHSSSQGSIVPTTEAATDSDVVAADRDDNGTGVRRRSSRPRRATRRAIESQLQSRKRSRQF